MERVEGEKVEMGGMRSFDDFLSMGELVSCECHVMCAC